MVVGTAASVLHRIACLVGVAANPRVAGRILDEKYFMKLAEHPAKGQGWPLGPSFTTPLEPWVLGPLLCLAAAVPLSVQSFQSVLGTGT
jgi:hypothetical protein